MFGASQLETIPAHSRPQCLRSLTSRAGSHAQRSSGVENDTCTANPSKRVSQPDPEGLYGSWKSSLWHFQEILESPGKLIQVLGSPGDL